MTLFWTGMRLGELLALTPADIDFENKTISISKSYQRLDGKDVTTLPKTPKSKRTITVPDFLLADLNDYMNSIYCLEKTGRLFQVAKYFMEHEIRRDSKAAGVKKIKIHGLRHICVIPHRIVANIRKFIEYRHILCANSPHRLFCL